MDSQLAHLTQHTPNIITMAFKSSTILSLPFAFAVVSALVVPDVKPCKDTPTLAVRQPPGFSCEKDCNCEGLTGNE